MQLSATDFTKVFDCLDGLIYVSDMETYELLYLNEFGKQHFPYQGKRCFEVILDECKACHFCNNKKFLEAGDDAPRTMKHIKLIRSTGRIYDQHDSMVTLSNGRKVKVSIGVDVTEREQAFEKIRHLNEELELYFEKAQNAFIVVDKEANILRSNSKLCEYLKLDKESLLKHKWTDFVSDESREKMLFYGQQRYSETGEAPETYEFELIDSEGHTRPCRNYVKKLESGKILASFIDISHEKEHIKELLSVNKYLEEWVENEISKRAKKDDLIRTIYNSIEMGISTTDSVGVLIDVNQRFCDIVQHDKDELIEKYFQTLIFDRDKSAFDVWFNRMTPEEVNDKKEFRLVRKDGEIIRVHVTSERILDDLGNPLKILIVNDVTEQLQLQEQALMHEQMLIQQSKLAAMGEMIGNIAHQWRQPINALSLMSFNVLNHVRTKYDIEDPFLDQFEVEHGELIQQMSRTIEDFRNFFIPNREKQQFSLVGQIEKALKVVRATLDYHDIEVTFKNEGDMKIFGYPTEFSQVLINIISNAKDALAEQNRDNRKIRIYTKSTAKSLLIRIADNAGGIPETVIHRIFDPYFTTKPEQQGTGIGLYMSRVIIEQNMQGIITARNIAGGAEFQIIFNRNESEALS